MNGPETPKPESTTQTPQKVEELRRALTKAPDLVRVEANIDAQPIWAPSSYADVLQRTYPLKWRGEDATVSVQSSGIYGMLRSFDKLVLTALVHLWNEQGRRDNGHVYFQVIDIIRALERENDGRLYQQIKDSLHRLRGCLIQYKLSFFSSDDQEWVSLRDKSILSDLLIVEPRKEDEFGIQMALDGLTYAVLDFMVVSNLLGNFTRPVSLRLLQSLSERGILFESYVNAVLYRHATVKKDVFELWHDLGLSTKGIDYGSQLASRMRKDLDKIAADENSPLASYSFEKSKTRARSQNLVLQRKKSADVTAPALPKQEYRTSDTPPVRRRSRLSDSEAEALVDWIRMELHDESDDATNLRVIASLMPEKVIREATHDAWAYYRDGQTKNPAAYFVGIMKRRAKELGVDLGLPESPRHQGTPTEARTPPPKPIGRRKRGGGVAAVGSLTEGPLRETYDRARRTAIEERRAALSPSELRALDEQATALTRRFIPADSTVFERTKRSHLDDLVLEPDGFPPFEDWVRKQS